MIYPATIDLSHYDLKLSYKIAMITLRYDPPQFALAEIVHDTL